MLLFSVWETRNGARPKEANELAAQLAASVTARVDRPAGRPARNRAGARRPNRDRPEAPTTTAPSTSRRRGPRRRGDTSGVPRVRRLLRFRAGRRARHDASSSRTRSRRSPCTPTAHPAASSDPRLAEQISSLFDRTPRTQRSDTRRSASSSVHLVRLLGERRRSWRDRPPRRSICTGHAPGGTGVRGGAPAALPRNGPPPRRLAGGVGAIDGHFSDRRDGAA